MSGWESVSDFSGNVTLIHDGTEVAKVYGSDTAAEVMATVVSVLNNLPRERIIRDWNGSDAPYWIG